MHMYTATCIHTYIHIYMHTYICIAIYIQITIIVFEACMHGISLSNTHLILTAMVIQYTVWLFCVVINYRVVRLS